MIVPARAPGAAAYLGAEQAAQQVHLRLADLGMLLGHVRIGAVALPQLVAGARALPVGEHPFAVQDQGHLLDPALERLGGQLAVDRPRRLRRAG